MVTTSTVVAQVCHMRLTSSDKAVDPANTMGTTKLLAEKPARAQS